MITEIGLAAGDILLHVEEQRETTLVKIINEIKKDKDIILMSLGWLAREGHILLHEERGEYKIISPKKS